MSRMGGINRYRSSLGARARATLLGTAMLALALVGPALAEDPDWSVVLNGKAIHIGANRDWNENNWGLGVERELAGHSPWVKVLFANGFIDSNDEMSYMAGGGIKRRFRPLPGRRDVYADMGVVGFLMTRRDVRDNEPFPGLLPAVTLGTDRFAMNLSYVPGRFVTHATDLRYEESGIKGIMFLQLKLALPGGVGALGPSR